MLNKAGDWCQHALSRDAEHLFFGFSFTLSVLSLFLA